MHKVILIEDDESIGFIYKRQLDLAGLQTDLFTNGKEGLEAVNANTYDLLLLDIMLPDVNGLDILKEIKSNEKTKSLTVILLTNLGQDNVIKQGLTLGAEGYLIKASLTPKQIVEEAKQILKSKESLKNTPLEPTTS